MNPSLRASALSITSADVLRTTRNVMPMPIDRRHKYFVELHGRRFPITQVLELATGLPTRFKAEDAHRILSRLGFDILVDLGDWNEKESEVRRLPVVFQKDDDGWEVASCPTLPGCHSQGQTRQEALDNIREAITGYLASVRKHNAVSPPSLEFQIVAVEA